MNGHNATLAVDGKTIPALEWMAPMKTNAEALLANILANPDDDTLRVIYADCLQENGQEERAEFIRVQCALAKLPRLFQVEYSDDGEYCSICGDVDPTGHYHCLECGDTTSVMGCSNPLCIEQSKRRSTFVTRQEEILFNHPDAHQDRLRLDWLSLDFAMTADSWKWSRGFVEQIWIRADRWEAHADRILAEQPVKAVTLTTRPVHDINHGGRWKQITFTDGTEAGRLGRVFAHAGDGLEVELPQEGWRLEIVERDEEAWSMRNRRVRMPEPEPEGHLLWEGPIFTLSRIAGLRGAVFGPVIATARNGHRYQCNGIIMDVTQHLDSHFTHPDTVRIEGRVTGEPILLMPE